jgi:LacI family transcriptional regulator
MASDFPCVVIDTPSAGKNKACVLIDNEMYSQLAVNEMINRGYKRIGMINGHTHASVSIGRLQGYKNALLQNGLEFDAELVRDAAFEYDLAAAETEKLLKHNVDGIFCASDIMAMAALETIRTKKLDVPADIGLFGFDGLLFTRFITPNLSTVVQDNYQKGYEAARLLYKILSNEDYVNFVYTGCEVRVTDSI